MIYEELIIKINISGKIKTIESKTKLNNNLNRETAKISTLLSRNVIKYEFLTGKDVLPEKDLNICL